MEYLHISKLLLLLILLSWRSMANHFRGGTVSWRYLGRSGSSHNMEVAFSFGWSKGQFSSSCTDAAIHRKTSTYDGGYSWVFKTVTHSSTNETTRVICTAYSYREDWGYGSNSFVATIANFYTPFHISFMDGDWMNTPLVSSARWALTARNIDLGLRSDTGFVNKPPTAVTSPIVKLRQGCAQTFSITYRDLDDDRVTCRYAILGANPDECAQTCNGPSSTGYSHFRLDQNACTIHYDGGGGTGFAAVTLVIADHPKTNIVIDGARSKSTSDFLSEIPLQFVVKIDPGSSCNSIPTYPSRTIQDGAEFVIPLNGALSKTIYAYSSSASVSIVHFVVIGPIGLQVSAPVSLGGNLYSASLWWNPTASEFGRVYDACYYAEDSAGYDGHKVCFSVLLVLSTNLCTVNNGGCSDICKMSVSAPTCSCSMPCWSLDVDGLTCIPNMTVSCDGESMSLSVDACASHKTVVVGDSIAQFSQRDCQLSHIGNNHFLKWNASTCGFRYEMNSAQVKYSGNIWIWRTFDTRSSLITRGEYRMVPIECTLSSIGNVSAEFVPELPFNNESFPVDFNMKGFGRFSFYFDFYKTSAFSSVVSPAEYPMSVTVNDRFYFVLGATGQPGFTFFTQDCNAITPALDAKQPAISYTFIRDGCFLDSTLKRNRSNNPMENWFSMKGFDFADNITPTKSSVDISLQCKVMLCDARNLTSRCFQGCIEPGRKKRSIFEEYAHTDDDHDDDNDESPPMKHVGLSESSLQTIKGRFILISDPKSSRKNDESSETSDNKLYWVLIGIGLALVVLALFLSFRITRSRRSRRLVHATDDKLPRYTKASNMN